MKLPAGSDVGAQLQQVQAKFMRAFSSLYEVCCGDEVGGCNGVGVMLVFVRCVFGSVFLWSVSLTRAFGVSM